jgi:hypothetical protein
MVGVNVKEAEPGRFPFIAAFMTLTTEAPNPARDYICSSSLITRTNVLISAHCTLNKLANETIILAGSANLNYGRVYSIFWWITYDTWAQLRSIYSQYASNDLAIIKVNNFIIFFE